MKNLVIIVPIYKEFAEETLTLAEVDSMITLEKAVYETSVIGVTDSENPTLLYVLKNRRGEIGPIPFTEILY